MEKNVRYSIREALRILRKRRFPTVATVGVVALCLLVLGTFLIATGMLFNTIKLIRDRIEIDVFLEDDLSQKSLRSLHQAVRRLDGVKRVEYISKDEALRQFRAELGEESELAKLLDTHHLPAMLRVIPKHDWKSEEKVQQIAHQVALLEGVEELEFGQRWIEVLDRAVRIAVGIDMALGILVTVGCLFVVFNTVGLAINAAAREISIMVMVGATDGFVRGPFLVWGVLLGTAGGVFASIVLWCASDAFEAMGAPIGWPPSLTFGGLVAFGAFVGGEGSLWAVRNVLQADEVKVR